MRTEIIIFGRAVFTNELLRNFLAMELSDCCIRLLEQLTDFQQRVDFFATRKTILLCDCRSFSPNYFLEQLHPFYLQSGNRIWNLFYNLERDAGLEAEIIQQGIQGVVFAQDKPKTLISAINMVQTGQLWASRPALCECLRSNADLVPRGTKVLRKKLTPRECQILGLIVDGSSNEMIAAHLCISRHTVKTHIYNIFRKIDVTNRMMASRWAERHLSETSISSLISLR